MGRTSDARERLIETAAELWYSRSYASVGVSEICERANVRKGSFYHFFASKQELALAVVDHYWQRSREEIVEPTLASGLAPLEKLLRLLEAQYVVQRSLKEARGAMYGCPFGNLAIEMSTQDEALRERLRDLFDQMARVIQSILDEAVAAEDIAPADTRETARSIGAYIEGAILLAKTANEPELMRELAPGVLRLAGADPERVAEVAGAPA